MHCTHGQNRTGYIVCYYLCNEHDVDLDVAMQAFGEARGLRIDKNYLIEDLKDRFGGFHKQKDFKNYETIWEKK